MFWNGKGDYVGFRGEEEGIESGYMNSEGKGVKEVREGVEGKISKLNVVESEKYKYGYGIVVDDYVIYGDCLLYKDVGKDIGVINCEGCIRFYFKDEEREGEGVGKDGEEINCGKGNYVKVVRNSDLFDGVFIE